MYHDVDRGPKCLQLAQLFATGLCASGVLHFQVLDSGSDGRGWAGLVVLCPAMLLISVSLLKSFPPLLTALAVLHQDIFFRKMIRAFFVQAVPREKWRSQIFPTCILSFVMFAICTYT